MVTISEIIEYCNAHQFDGTLIYFLDKIGPLDDGAYAKFALEIIENFYQCTNSGQMCMMQLIHHADDHDPTRSTKFFNSLVYFDLQKSAREELYDILGHCGNKTTISHLKYVFFNEQDDDCRY